MPEQSEHTIKLARSDVMNIKDVSMYTNNGTKIVLSSATQSSTYSNNTANKGIDSDMMSYFETTGNSWWTAKFYAVGIVDVGSVFIIPRGGAGMLDRSVGIKIYLDTVLIYTTPDHKTMFNLDNNGNAFNHNDNLVKGGISTKERNRITQADLDATNSIYTAVADTVEDMTSQTITVSTLDLSQQIIEMSNILIDGGYIKTHQNVVVSSMVKDKKIFFTDGSTYTFDPSKAVRYNIWTGTAKLPSTDTSKVAYIFVLTGTATILKNPSGYNLVKADFFNSTGGHQDINYSRNLFYNYSNYLLINGYSLTVDEPVEGGKFVFSFYTAAVPNRIVPSFETLIQYPSFRGLNSTEGNGFLKYTNYNCSSDLSSEIKTVTKKTATECDTECDNVSNCTYYSFENTDCTLFSDCKPSYVVGKSVHQITFDKLAAKSFRFVDQVTTDLNTASTELLQTTAELNAATDAVQAATIALNSQTDTNSEFALQVEEQIKTMNTAIDTANALALEQAQLNQEKENIINNKDLTITEREDLLSSTLFKLNDTTTKLAGIKQTVEDSKATIRLQTDKLNESAGLLDGIFAAFTDIFGSLFA